jgi:hypothetical protein
MICIDCHTAETPSPQHKRCIPCAKVRKQLQSAETAAKQKAIKLAKIRDHPELCQEHLCVNLHEPGKGRCAFHLAYRREYTRKAAEQGKVERRQSKVAAEEQINPSPPWTPRPKPPPLMTDAEQRRIDRETASRMFGDYRHSPVRLYTAQEIANYVRGLMRLTGRIG